MSNPYTEEYYRTSNYSDYAERGERYYKLARETTSLLESLTLINKTTPIVDFGCATGHLLNGLKHLGFKHTTGVEISDWAREQCLKKGFNAYNSISGDYGYRVVYALDVLLRIPIC
jgi:SAM-dependent methyltransferase